MTSARTIARPPTQCPYCDHVSPEDSKFCNECGAALHLKPCPHCGSLNDITKTEACLRCGGTLAAEAPPAPQPAAPAVPSAANDALIVAEPQERPAGLPPPPSRRAAPLVAAVALGLLTAAGFYGYRAQAPQPQPPAPAKAVPAPAPAGPPPVPIKSPDPAPAPVADPIPDTPRPAPPPSPPPRAGRSTAPAPPTPPPANTARSIELPPAALGPCTAAVAALGLCTEAGNANNSNDRRP